MREDSESIVILSSHKLLLDLKKRRVFSEPLALGGILVAERAVDVGVCDGEELLKNLLAIIGEVMVEVR